VEHPVAGGGTTPTSKKSGKKVLLSPSSIAPAEGSPIFSIPKSEVSVEDGQFICKVVARSKFNKMVIRVK